MTIPLSFNQEFLCMFDQGDEEGPFGPRYNIVGGWRLYGKTDADALRRALDDVVVRHEGLRTSIVRDADTPHQEILAPGPVDLEIRELPAEPADRDRRAEELLIDVEGGRYGVTDPPLLRAVLGRFDDQDAVLVLVVHHTAADEVSMQLIIRDLAALYAGHTGHQPPPLPEVTQFQDFARWERERFAPDSATAAKARAYWREQLAGGAITGVPTDHLKSAGIEKTTAVHRFQIGAELTAATVALARSTRSTAFMVLLAAYQVFLSERTGVTDVAVPTMASGRGPRRFENTVGAFFNFVPLRTDTAGCATFRQMVERTRTTCFRAYAHELPFGQVVAEAPEVAAPFAADDLGVFAFQVFQFPPVEREPAGDLAYSEIRRRVLSQAVSTDIPDGAMLQLAVDAAAGEMVGHLGYNTNIYREDSMAEMAAAFADSLRTTVATPDAPLRTTVATPDAPLRRG
ncbi:condensation domain-containing protein [Streptomyces jumonjinensis]|uniref:condensation domain-containing protein n=1 Tax=Streptomyces jumonjinensis TaxID=1945 RepID=UPI0037959A2A